MRKNLKILFICSVLVSLSGCTQFRLSAEDLIHPPALTQEQTDISTALEKAVGVGGIKYKYPKNGNYRSSFIFKDIDQDGSDEALVFYQIESRGDSCWLNVLDKENEQWYSVCDISSPNSEAEVDFIDFQTLLGEKMSIVVGWTDEYMNNKCASVYDYNGKSLNMNFSQEYNFLCFDDLNKDKQLDMIAVNCDPYYEESEVSLITKRTNIQGKNELSITSTLTLPHESSEIISVKSGMVNNSTRAVFIDSIIATSKKEKKIVTQAVAAYGKDLVNLLDGDETHLSDSTIRITSSLCEDVNGDEIIEIPTITALPLHEESSEEIFLTTFNQLGVGRSFIPVKSCVINEAHRYLVNFPEKWKENVTVSSTPESNEWNFIKYSENPNELSQLLLRIKVYSVKDYHDKFENEYYQLLGTKGLFEYYAHIPEGSNIDENELKELFEWL